MYYGIAELSSRGIVWRIIEYIERCSEGRELVVGFVHIWYFSYRVVWIGPLRIIRGRIWLLGSNPRYVPIYRNVNVVTRRSRIKCRIYEQWSKL